LIETLAAKNRRGGFAVGVERLVMCIAPEENAKGFAEDRYFIVTLGTKRLKKVLNCFHGSGRRACGLHGFCRQIDESQMRARQIPREICRDLGRMS